MKKSFASRRRTFAQDISKENYFEDLKRKRSSRFQDKGFKVHKTTMIFKINLVKLIDKHPKLMKSSVTLGFLKTYFKDIKEIRGENLKNFKYVKITCLRANP